MTLNASAVRLVGFSMWRPSNQLSEWQKAKRPPNKNEFVGMVLGIFVKHYFVDFVLWRGGCVDQIGNYFFESKAVGHPLQTQSVVFFRRMYNIFIRIPNTIFITLNHIIKQNWHQFPPPQNWRHGWPRLVYTNVGMEHHVPKITGPLLAKWCLLDKICQYWKLSEDFSDLFAHVNLMLDIVFDVQKVAEMERGLVCLQKYLVSYHDFFC